MLQGGGGIYSDGGTLTVQSGTTINNNMASYLSASGGGIFLSGGTNTINDAAVSTNSTTHVGGGIEVRTTFSAAMLTLKNVTLGGQTPAEGRLHFSGRCV